MNRLYLRSAYTEGSRLDGDAKLSDDPQFRPGDSNFCCRIGPPVIDDERIELRLVVPINRGGWEALGVLVDALVLIVSERFALHVSPHPWDDDLKGTLTVHNVNPEMVTVGKAQFDKDVVGFGMVCREITVIRQKAN